MDLVCIVHGRPPPDVVWTRDGRPLPDTLMDTKLHQPRTHTAHDAHMTQNHVAHRHTLSIKPVTEKDFGAYVCIAENTHGRKNAVIQMTGERLHRKTSEEGEAMSQRQVKGSGRWTGPRERFR